MTAPLNGGSGKSTTPQTTQNRCYPSDSDAAATGGEGAGSWIYLPVEERDYSDDDRHRAYEDSFPEPERADQW